MDRVFEIICQAPDIEGVTFVGGEPFSQATALASLGVLCQMKKLSVVTFTGYLYEHLLQQNRSDWNALLAVTDLLLAGPYIQRQRDFSRPWVGSRNQQFVFLTDRYRHLKESLSSIRNQLEVQVCPTGSVLINGMASTIELADLQKELTHLGVQFTPKVVFA